MMTSDLIHLEFASQARGLLSLRLMDISNLLPFNQFTFSIFRTHRKLGNATEHQAATFATARFYDTGIVYRC